MPSSVNEELPAAIKANSIKPEQLTRPLFEKIAIKLDENNPMGINTNAA